MNILKIIELHFKGVNLNVNHILINLFGGETGGRQLTSPWSMGCSSPALVLACWGIFFIDILEKLLAMSCEHLGWSNFEKLSILLTDVDFRVFHIFLVRAWLKCSLNKQHSVTVAIDIFTVGQCSELCIVLDVVDISVKPESSLNALPSDSLLFNNWVVKHFRSLSVTSLWYLSLRPNEWLLLVWSENFFSYN